MNETFLFNTIIKKYSNPDEIEYLKKMSHTGLEDYEEIAIEKYCKAPADILTIGCGAGREAIALAKRNFSVTAIDIVETLARLSYKEAKKMSLKGFFLAMNACNLGFHSDSFDYVFLLSQVISLIPLRKNRINTLKECGRVLKKEGILMLTTHSREKNRREKLTWEIINFIRKIKAHILKGTPIETGDKWVVAISGYKLSKEKIFMHLYTPEEALEDIKTAGLTPIDVVSATEIVNERYCPKIRKSDKYIFYIVKK